MVDDKMPQLEITKAADIDIRAKRTPAGKPEGFDPAIFLGQAGIGRRIVDLKKGQIIFSQGAPADTVCYIHRGRARLSVVSPSGKQATISLLAKGDFLGEDCIANSRPLRMATATAVTEGSILKIDREEMIRVLHKEQVFANIVMSYLLSRNLRIQEDLVDQLFNSSEKRLARALLLLAQFGKEGTLDAVIPKMSQETLAEMIGTTRSRVSFFMNRFRKLGFIEYNRELRIRPSLLSVVLHD